mgnify:CR=1 FL=1
MKIIAIIQARLGSSRLPGKVLMDICGKPMLAHVIERARAIRGVDVIILTTPWEDRDPILEALRHWLADSIIWHPHHPPDVLSGMHTAVNVPRVDVVLRLTGDCPLFDPALGDLALTILMDGHYDYVGTTRPDITAQYPDGFDVEVVTREAFEYADQMALGEDRQHVLSFLWSRPERFRVYGLRLESQWDWARSLKLSVDTADDLASVRRIMARIPPNDYSMAATLQAAQEIAHEDSNYDV